MITLHPDCQVANLLSNLLKEPLVDEQLKQSHIDMCLICENFNKQNQPKTEEEEV